MRLTLSVAVLIALTGCRPVEESAPAAQLILPLEHSLGSWVPSSNEVRDFEAALIKLFSRPDRRFSEKPQYALGDYYLRYYGILRDGEKLIVGQGCHISTTDLPNFRSMNTQPDTVLLSPFGGGSFYFSSTYDPAKGRVRNVIFNAAL